MNSLYDKLRLAEKYNMQADDIKTMIDNKAIIDTKIAVDKKAFMIADIALQKDSAIDMEEIKNASRVIYWKAKEDLYNTNILGLAWQGKSVYFFSGEVLTP